MKATATDEPASDTNRSRCTAATALPTRNEAPDHGVDLGVTPHRQDGRMTRHPLAEQVEQLSLLPAPSTPVRFRLDEATRRRGLLHIAQIRAQLERQAA